MDNYYTLMVVPEKNKKIKTLRMPGFLFRSLSVVLVIIIIITGILAYDYWKILGQVYENKHLALENKQLKEQLQIFQMKLNSLSSDLERINTFEKKLRVITGLEDISKAIQVIPDDEAPSLDDKFQRKDTSIPLLEKKFFFDDIESTPQFEKLKKGFDQKIADSLGYIENYEIPQQWSFLAARTFQLSYDYARFEFQYSSIKEVINELELKVHKLDEHLLDKESFLKSTPTLLPAPGWITSYYGQRISPYSGQLKMHEGLDVGAPTGTPIYAPADGIVTFSGVKSGFGKFVQIDHGYGMETVFAHSSSLHVKSGEKIKRGNLIAKVGSTGHSTGPHLHYEVRVNGIPIDPLYFVLD
jgi:murein DD-endopeptidase MepM/ murein hydrolase activator NlpD